MGTGFDIAISQEEEGIIPRAVAHLFDGITKRKQDAKQRNEPLPDFKVTVQFMEVIILHVFKFLLLCTVHFLQWVKNENIMFH